VSYDDGLWDIYYEKAFKQTSERRKAMTPLCIYVLKIGFPIRWTVKHLSKKKNLILFAIF